MFACCVGIVLPEFNENVVTRHCSLACITVQKRGWHCKVRTCSKSTCYYIYIFIYININVYIYIHIVKHSRDDFY